jgi:molybdopterin biosynthesis enzyme
LSEDVYCEESFPPFPASTMDGYAVIAEDCPKDLEVIGIISASGNISDIIVSSGYCAQITTGSPIPKGANAVIKVNNEMNVLFWVLFNMIIYHTI